MTHPNVENRVRPRYSIESACRRCGTRTSFRIYEFKEDGSPLYTYENGQHQATLSVDLIHPYEKYGELSGAEVSWPSTSDKRPILARALADALILAYVEAERLDREAGL